MVRKRYDRHAGTWAAATTGASFAAAATPGVPTAVVALHPPTERAALADQAAAIAWARSWQGFDDVTGAVSWGERRWANLGTQRVPERLVLATPADTARVAGRTAHWSRLSTRFARLATEVPGNRAALTAALPGTASEVAAWDDGDFERLVLVLAWLAEHPDSGLYIRQLPIRGVDSKWVGTHRRLVQRLHLAASGRADLGLAIRPDLVRVRFLDPDLAPGGLGDVSAPVADLAGLDITPRTVLVVENLETILAVPALEGTVVVHGSGYAVERLDRIPWVRGAGVVYWGDLDSHGFAILNRLRAHGIAARSVLMDTATLEAYADLCVPEPKPSTATLEYLTTGEHDALRLLAERGNMRLEQERIDWAHAVDVLTRAAIGPAG